MHQTASTFQSRFIRGGVKEQLRLASLRFHGHADNGNVFQLMSLILILMALALSLTLFAGYHGLFFYINAAAKMLPASVWAMITYLGDTKIALAMLLFFARRNPALLAVVLVAALFGTCVSHGLKEGIGAIRPYGVLAAGDWTVIGQALTRKSFPSGHSLTIFVFVSSVFYFCHQRRTKVMLITMGCVIALSRVVVGAHWPVDTLVGAALGISCTLVGVWATKRWRAGFSLWVHYLVLSLLILATVLIFLDNGGYPQAQPMAWLIGCSALIYVTIDYIFLPYPFAVRVAQQGVL